MPIELIIMVIKYSIEDLHYIRNVIRVRDTLEMVLQGPETNKLQEDLNPYQQHIHLLGHPIHFNRGASIEPPSESLSPSVADFFMKAQQNFYVHTQVDPTKVRRLSEVEAELINVKNQGQ